MTLISRLLKNSRQDKVEFSIIVIAYDMGRELPRTLHSLSQKYQQRSEGINYEVIVVDNGSPEPVAEEMVRSHGDQFRLLRIDDASPSPGDAVNRAAAQAKGQYLGIIIDGARMLTPGVLAWAHEAFTLRPRSVVSVLGFHLGPEHQGKSSQKGYNQDVEDRLLERIKWPTDGYRLFEISSLAGSSRYAWHGPIAESNCLFLPGSLFTEIGGYETRFASPGGGLINLDFYKRACEADKVELIYLVGEGCFHQIHGGVTTGGEHQQALKYRDFEGEYQDIRGSEIKAPPNQPILLGHAQATSAWLVREGAVTLVEKIQLERGRRSHMESVGLAPETGD